MLRHHVEHRRRQVHIALAMLLPLQERLDALGRGLFQQFFLHQRTVGHAKPGIADSPLRSLQPRQDRTVAGNGAVGAVLLVVLGSLGHI